MHKKKICHICTTFIYKSEGIRRIYRIMRRSAEENYSVTNIVGRDYQPDRNWDTTEICTIRVRRMVKYIKPAKDAAALYGLYKELKNIRPDIVHTHLAKAGILGRIAARLAGVPVIIHTVHGPSFPGSVNFLKRFFYLSLERFTARFTDFFVFVGGELRDMYVKNGVCPAGKTAVIRTGRPEKEICGADTITPLEIEAVRNEFLKGDKTAFLIGYVGRLVPSKAQEKAVSVLKAVRSRGINAHMALIGEGQLSEEKGYEKSLRDLINRMDLSAYIHLTGYRSDIFPCLKAMDILISTSKHEGLSNMPVETGIAGKPFIAFDVCGMRETLEDGVGGYILRQNDTAGMAEKIVAMAGNPGLSRKMGENARRAVSRGLTAETMTAKILKLYSTLLIEKNTSAGGPESVYRTSDCSQNMKKA